MIELKDISSVFDAEDIAHKIVDLVLDNETNKLNEFPEEIVEEVELYIEWVDAIERSIEENNQRWFMIIKKIIEWTRNKGELI